MYITDGTTLLRTNSFYEYRCHPFPSSTHNKVFSEGANYISATLH